MNPAGRIDPRRREGFTILEILISTVILVIGLLGLLALFPVALKLGTITIENTNAALIARSVEQAVREGVQNRKGQDPQTLNTFFLLQHDGVKDPLPRRLVDAVPSADNYILFPEPSDSSQREYDRGDAYRQGKLFVYPETDGQSWQPLLDGVTLDEVSDLDSGSSPNGGGDVRLADDDKDDIEIDSENQTYGVYRTYSLSNQFLTGLGIDEDDDEFDSTGAKDDPISQYSFALAIRPAYRDASLNRRFPTEGTLIPAGELYEVEILVYRSFFYVEGGGNAREPILSRTILVHR